MYKWCQVNLETTSNILLMKLSKDKKVSDSLPIYLQYHK